MIDHTVPLSLPPMPREREAVAEPLLARTIEALRRLLASAPLDVLQAASAAPTGAGSLATLVSHLPEISPALAEADPEAAAVARAAEVKRSLFARTPTHGTPEVARLLGLTPEGVRKRRLAGRLLALEHAGDWRFPAWQFTPTGVLEGLEPALAAIPVANPWVRLELLTAPLADHGNRSALDLLRAGAVDDAVAALATYGEAGG